MTFEYSDSMQFLAFDFFWSNIKAMLKKLSGDFNSAVVHDKLQTRSILEAGEGVLY